MISREGMVRLGPLSLVLGLALVGAPARAEMTLSGLVDLVGKVSDPDYTNVTFGGTSNLDAVRGRLFLDATVAENVDAFGQVLATDAAGFTLYGAYVRIRDVGPTQLQLGIIPTPIGNWGPRTYSDRNPLVGVPLVQNHHTSLRTRERMTLDDLLANRDIRASGGLPILYDNCWNLGAEISGEVGAFDWSVAALAGSLAKPSREQTKDVPMGTGRLGWWIGPGLCIAADGWVGPYLDDGVEWLADDGIDPNDYLSGGFGGDVYASFRYLELHSEVYRAFWEAPGLPDLWITSGYVDAKYKLMTRWYVAARAEFFEPDRVDLPGGGAERWDYPVERLEWGVGVKPAPRVTVKAVAQHNRSRDTDLLDGDHYLLQFSAGF
ncbi:MAG: hypothetical protein KC591_01820 [Gemmatimonadetes bacterium]|nr:hypothetical protein [Gemmatimonadota bacterium]